MAIPSEREVTQLLVDWSNGDQSALDELLPLVHAELCKLAHHLMSRERPDHTLQTTALVNEAYLRLACQNNTQWRNRAQFFAIAARLMRRTLIDHARSHQYAKRGGGAQKTPLDEETLLNPQRAEEIVALDEALQNLSAFDARKGHIVELRYFGGLSVEETAEVLKVSPVTVMRDWSIAKAWLRREISGHS